MTIIERTSKGRFASFVMDNDHLPAAARYIELNPVRAKIVRKAHRYPYSSARSHVQGRADPLVCDSPLTRMVDDWAKFLSAGTNEEEQALFRGHERTGRPLGGKRFIAKLEKLLDRPLFPKKGGRPPKAKK